MGQIGFVMNTMGYVFLALAVISVKAEASGLHYQGGHHYGGAGVYYQQDLNRLERNYRNLDQRYRQSLERCQSDLERQQRIYLETLSRQQGLGASIDELRAANETLSQTTDATQSSRQGPSQEAYDDLQGRYDSLLAAHRNLERDYRALTVQP